MPAPSSSSSSQLLWCYYTPHYQAALELEASVLNALLRRNAASQRRTKYYQRLDQALRFLLRKSKLMRLWDDAIAVNREATERVDASRKRRARQTLFWELLPTTTDEQEEGGTSEGNNHKATTTASIKPMEGKTHASGADENGDGAGLASRLAALVECLTRDVPEALSRLHHAAEALWKEVARGFFLPFCTVALAAVARLRILLLSLAGHVSQVLIPPLPGLCRQLLLEEKKPPLWNDAWDDGPLRDLQTFLELQIVEAPPTLTTPRKPTLERSLRDLSLPPPAHTKQPSATEANAPSDSKDATSEPRREDKSDARVGTVDVSIGRGPDDVPPQEATTWDPNVPPTEALDDHDVGESVGVSATDTMAATSPALAVTAWDGIDRNLDLVERLRNRPKKDPKKKKKERKEQKKRPSNPEQSQVEGESKPSKRLKKKDFFDDVFGS